MTIAKTGNRAQYTGDGTTVAFAYGFRFFNDSDLGVYVLSTAGVESKKVLTTDYTVTNTGTEDGGTVTFNTALATGEIVTILGEVPQTQSVDLSDNDAFPAETLEGALDRATRLVQRVDERLNRSLVLPISTTLANITLPTPQANTAIGWNAAADNLANIQLLDEGVQINATGDNAVMRYDSGGQSLQDSGVLIDDSDNVTGIADLTITGDFDVNGSLTVDSTTFTAAGLALMDDANAAAQRTTLGLGTAATVDVIDEDDMASDSATRPPSQQSVKAYVDNNSGGTIFTSAEQTISAGGGLTLPHGLGERPNFVTVLLVCKTAQHGYSVGDVLVYDFYSYGGNTGGDGPAIVVDATNLVVRFCNNSTATNIMGLNKSTGVRTTLTDANWNAIFIAKV